MHISRPVSYPCALSREHQSNASRGCNSSHGPLKKRERPRCLWWKKGFFAGPAKGEKEKGKKDGTLWQGFKVLLRAHSLVLATTTCEFRESKKKRVKSDNSNNVGMNKGNEIKFLLVREREWKRTTVNLTTLLKTSSLPCCVSEKVTPWLLPRSLALSPQRSLCEAKEVERHTQKRMKSQKLLIRQNHGKQPGRRRRPSQWR